MLEDCILSSKPKNFEVFCVRVGKVESDKSERIDDFGCGRKTYLL